MVHRGGRKTDNLMGRYKKNNVEGYKHLAEIKAKCEEIGITYNCFRCRVYNGWTEEEALLAPNINVREPSYLYKGESARKYLKEHGGKYSTFMYHVKRMSVEEAVEKTLQHKGNVLFYRDGMTLAKWCKLHNKDYNNEYKKEVRNAKRRENS